MIMATDPPHADQVWRGQIVRAQRSNGNNQVLWWWWWKRPSCNIFRSWMFSMLETKFHHDNHQKKFLAGGGFPLESVWRGQKVRSMMRSIKSMKVGMILIDVMTKRKFHLLRSKSCKQIHPLHSSLFTWVQSFTICAICAILCGRCLKSLWILPQFYLSQWNLAAWSEEPPKWLIEGEEARLPPFFLTLKKRKVLLWNLSAGNI